MLFKLKNLIRKKGLQLLHSNLMIELNAFVYDAEGNKIKTFSKVSDSLTGNFLQILYTHFSDGNTVNYLLSSFNGGTNSSTKKTDSIPVSSKSQLFCNSNANDSTFGLLYGMDSTPVNPLDYKLITPITNGTGLNNLLHNQMQSSQAPQAVGNTTTFKIFRLFTNNSGLAITVNECGLYINITAGQSICIYRDIIAGGLIIPNGGVSQLELTFNVTT